VVDDIAWASPRGLAGGWAGMAGLECSLGRRHRRLQFVASTDRCDSPFLYSFSISGYARSWTKVLHNDCGSTVVAAAFRTEPGILADNRSGA
jgi:hypothetical protein